MIYMTNGQNITKIDHQTSYVIAMAYDCSTILISSSVVPTNFEIMKTIDDSELDSVLKDPIWIQPCKNC